MQPSPRRAPTGKAIGHRVLSLGGSFVAVSCSAFICPLNPTPTPSIASSGSGYVCHRQGAQTLFAMSMALAFLPISNGEREKKERLQLTGISDLFGNGRKSPQAEPLRYVTTLHDGRHLPGICARASLKQRLLPSDVVFVLFIMPERRRSLALGKRNDITRCLYLPGDRRVFSIRMWCVDEAGRTDLLRVC